MNILLIGGHQTTRFLTKTLKLKNYNITVINDNETFCTSLADEYDILSICGDGTDPAVLKNARIDKMDLVVALEDKDASNLLICQIAQKQFHAPKAIAFVADPQNLELFRELGVDRCISTTEFIADMIEQEAVADSIRHYVQIENGKVAIFEAVIDESSPVLGCKLWEIGLPPQSIIGSIIRGKETIIPQGNTELKLFDKAIVLSSSDSVEHTLGILTGKREKHK